MRDFVGIVLTIFGAGLALLLLYFCARMFGVGAEALECQPIRLFLFEFSLPIIGLSAMTAWFGTKLLWPSWKIARARVLTVTRGIVFVWLVIAIAIPNLLPPCPFPTR